MKYVFIILGSMSLWILLLRSGTGETEDFVFAAIGTFSTSWLLVELFHLLEDIKKGKKE